MSSSETNQLKPLFQQRRFEVVGAETRMENRKWDKKMICCVWCIYIGSPQTHWRFIYALKVCFHRPIVCFDGEPLTSKNGPSSIDPLSHMSTQHTNMSRCLRFYFVVNKVFAMHNCKNQSVESGGIVMVHQLLMQWSSSIH